MRTAQHAGCSSLNLRSWPPAIRACITSGVVEIARAQGHLRRPGSASFARGRRPPGGLGCYLSADAYRSPAGGSCDREDQATEPESTLMLLRLVRAAE